MVKWYKSGTLLVIISLITLINFAIRESSANYLRLPKAIKPTHYEIYLKTMVHDEGDRNYSGEVKINLDVVENTDQILLHHRGLSIISVELFNNMAINTTWSYDDVREILTIRSNNALIQGDQLRLEIKFSGMLQTGTAGFYRSQYQVAGENETRYLAATQFEPTRARSAFPCFDEPEWRSTFKLSIEHGLKYTAISNMVGTNITTNLVDNTTTTSFPTTSVSMPTYLLAFVVSDLEYISLVPSDPLMQRIYATKDLVDDTYSSLLYSEMFLVTLEGYLNTKYSLPKLYSAALPDHGSAMENYGLILYKEQYLVSEQDPHPNEVYDVVGTITHELTHQFFGNMVTCKWWDQIWLNEGFATWGEFLLPELYGATKNMEFHHLFNIKKTQNAMRSDSLQTTRPMTYETSTNAEISSRFDRIAYDKSGAVIRMFQYMISDENQFKLALKQYLSDNEHKSVTSDELMQAFERHTNFSFSFTEAFRSWENQKGYPVIYVSHNNFQKEFNITQKRYLSANEIEEDINEKWHIPLSYTTSVQPDINDGYFTHHFMLNETYKNISTATSDVFSWYIFNNQQHGFYRVNYDDSNWQAIIKVLNSPNYKQIHVLNRAQLVDDALTMAFDGYLSYEIAFGVASYLTHETEYYPWYSAAIAFDKFDYLLRGDPLQNDFRTFVHYLITKMYAMYGVEHKSTDSIIKQLARELANDWACRLDDEKCLKISQEDLINNTSIPPALQITHYCHGLRQSKTSNDFLRLKDKMDKSIYQTERLRIIDGLLCSTDKESLKNLLSDMLNNQTTFYRTHERRRAFNSLVARSSVGLEALCEFVTENYTRIKSVMGDGFIESILIAASIRIVEKPDEKSIIDVLVTLRNDPLYVLPETTITEVLKNINNNRKSLDSIKNSNVEFYIKNFLSSKWRLPKNLTPTSYDIHLDVRDVQKGDLPYSGEVTMNVDVVEATDEIAFHSKNQNFDNITVRSSGSVIPIIVVSKYLIYDQVYITVDRILNAGIQVQITIKYRTELLTEIDGLYQDFYYDNDGLTVKYLATTQFQAVEARRVFPCLDEPAFKAIFKVRITHDETYSAVANAPVADKINHCDGTFTSYFEPTKVMSSYLNAFLISDFETITNNDTKVPGEALQGIWTRPGESRRAEYALNNSVIILNKLEEYVNFTFSLPKLDSAAIPGKGGGMENWGLVLYREAAMIYDEDISHTLRQRGVRLIAHEIVHMFFGNLVTGEWWNYLWINEGFATDLMYSLLDNIYPDWGMKEFFSRNIMIPYAFVTDGSDSTRSMSSELITTSDINNSFDDIAYDKAACVLRMFSYALGEDNWREGLHHFLDKNQYKPVNSQHLIDAMEKVIVEKGLNFPHFERAFRTWENQEGVPLVTVVYNSQNRSFVLTQQRFFETKDFNPDDESSWYIPINFVTELDPNFEDTKVTDFLRDGEKDLRIPITNFDNSKWFIFNVQQIGYYRVNYDTRNWQALTRILHSNHSKIHVVNRVHLIDNAFVLAHGGYLDYKIPYDIITYLINDNSFFTWDMFMDNINRLFDVFGPRDQILNRFIYQMSKNFYNQYFLPSDNIIPDEVMPVRYGRELAYFIACRAGNPDCRRHTNILGKLDVEGTKFIPRGLEEPVLCNYFRNGSVEGWNNVFERMNKLQQNVDYTFKTNLINALACTNNPTYLYELLESSLETDLSKVNYTQSDRRNVFNAVLRNENGIETAIKLIDNYGQSNAPVESYGWSWQRILLNIADVVYTEEEKTIYQNFIARFQHPDVTTNVLERANSASTANIEAQSHPQNVRQTAFIVDILERVFNETITSTPPTTMPSTTTPDSGSVTHISLFLVMCLATMIMKF